MPITLRNQQLQKFIIQMQKTKPIYSTLCDYLEPHRHSERRCRDQSYQNDFNYTISPLLHQELVFSILNYQTTESQQEVSLTMEDFIRNLHSDYYGHCEEPDPENLNEERIKKARSLQQINLQYCRQMQKLDSGRAPSTPRVRFSEESTAKYFRKEDAASELANSEEYCFSPCDQNEQLYRFNL